MDSSSFLTLGDTSGDELSYFRQMLEVAQAKTDNVGYAERRAQEMASGDMMEDYSLEGKCKKADPISYVQYFVFNCAQRK